MDINGDGKLDLIAGNSPGEIYFYKNIGTATAPKLAAGVRLKYDGKEITGQSPNYKVTGNTAEFVPTPDAVMGTYSKVHVTDWDGDGLLDLLVGHTSAASSKEEIVFYKNIGSKADPTFAKPVSLDLFKDGRVSRPSPFVVDWDGDGKRDLIVGTDSKDVLFLRNTGTNEKPVFAKPEKIDLPGLEECYRCRPCVVDWNNDGKLDLLVGNIYSSTVDGKRNAGGHIWLFLRK